MHSDDIGELSPEELSALAVLDHPQPYKQARRSRKGKSRQTYRRRYSHLIGGWNRWFRAYAAVTGYQRALSQVRANDIKDGKIEFPSEPPTEMHVDWWRRKILADQKAEVRATLAANDHMRGISPKERKRINDANRKLKRSADTYHSGENVPSKYNVERKLMSPAEQKKYDNEKRRIAQKERRAAKRIAA
jgi:hypothetical protein